MAGFPAWLHYGRMLPADQRRAERPRRCLESIFGLWMPFGGVRVLNPIPEEVLAPERFKEGATLAGFSKCLRTKPGCTRQVHRLLRV